MQATTESGENKSAGACGAARRHLPLATVTVLEFAV